MHILFLTDNFPPEGNAPASRTYEHAREWVKEGHKVTVITCAPNYPEGIVFPGYKNHWLRKEVMDGIEVRRVKTFITANEGIAKRSLDHISFMLSSLFFGVFINKVDVVIATSPQFFTAISGRVLSWLKRVPYVFELRDIWPASITAVGAMKKSFLISVLERIEMFLYKSADLIVAVTHSFRSELISRGVDGSKIAVVLNGVDLRNYSPRGKDLSLLKKYDLNGKFVVGYLGTHGMAHQLSNVVRAAEILRDEPDTLFLFAGGGAGLDEVFQLVKEKELNNVLILGRQEKHLMPRIWSLCDLSLVHLKNSELFSTVIPSKMFESMAMGIPMLVSMPKGEATDIVKSNGVGVVIEPESPQELADAIRFLGGNSSERERMVESAVNSALMFDRRKLANDMLEHLKKL